MSERSAPGMDPRFDPRFQRGYVPDAAALVSEPVPARPAPAPAPEVDHRGAEAPALDIRDLPTHSDEDDGPAVPDAGVPEFVPDAAPATGGGPEPEPGPTAAILPIRWFLIALGACLAFVVIGAVAYWVQASDPPRYTVAGQTGIDETMSMVIMALAPGLVQAGVLGVVLVLVAWAVGAGRNRERQ